MGGVLLALSGLSLATLCLVVPALLPPFDGGYLPTPLTPFGTAVPSAFLRTSLSRFAPSLPAALSLELSLLGCVWTCLILAEGARSGLRLRALYLLLGPWATGHAPVAALFAARVKASRGDGNRRPMRFALGPAVAYVVATVAGVIAMSTTSVLARSKLAKSAAAAAAAAAAAEGSKAAVGAAVEDGSHPLMTPFGMAVFLTVVALPLLLVVLGRDAPLRSSEDAEDSTHDARTLFSITFGAAVALFTMTRAKLLVYIVSGSFSPAAAFAAVAEAAQSSYAAAFVTGDLLFLTLVCIAYVFLVSEARIAAVKKLAFALLIAVAPALGFSAFLAVTSRTKRFSTIKME